MKIPYQEKFTEHEYLKLDADFIGIFPDKKPTKQIKYLKKLLKQVWEKGYKYAKAEK